MKKYSDFLKRSVIVLGLTLSALSCSFGFLNFASETGRIELDFKISGTNYEDVDSIEYSFTPPKGLGITVRRELDGSSVWYELDNADIGTWTVSGTMYAGNEALKEFDYDIPVEDNKTFKLSIEARWDSGEYNILYEEDVYENKDDGTEDDTTDPAFTFDSLKVTPIIHESYSSGERNAAVNVRILGSGFHSGLEGFSLSYPDGAVYEVGYSNSRDLQIYHFTDSSGTEIEIQRSSVYDVSGLNGSYGLRLDGEWGSPVSKSTGVAIDVDYLMPVLTSPSIPATVDSMADQNFDYAFTSSAEIGTKLVFVVNRSDGADFYPADPSIVVAADAGTLTVPMIFLSGASDYDLIVAAIGYGTLDPVSDAVDAGITTPDLRAEGFYQTILAIYGEDTGFILYESAQFSTL